MILIKGRGGVGVCSVPCNRKVAGSNIPQATVMRRDLGQVAQCSFIINIVCKEGSDGQKSLPGNIFLF